MSLLTVRHQSFSLYWKITFYHLFYHFEFFERSIFLFQFRTNPLNAASQLHSSMNWIIGLTVEHFWNAKTIWKYRWIQTVLITQVTKNFWFVFELKTITKVLWRISNNYETSKNLNCFFKSPARVLKNFNSTEGIS